ncbi:MAG: suppressor of fused domain protein [Clostridiales Family XIII bacterium]|jgi:hypothetical protein|nr:suppressor of fused domain protein [Clostridiales Family XIII bacterium]
MKKQDILRLFSSRADPPRHCYSREEEALFLRHITRRFGAPKRMLPEPYPQDIKADAALIAPSPERPWYALITVGMGAFVMDVPPDLIDCELERAELMICLPPNWHVGSPRSEWRWPLDWLRALAHIPAGKETWLGWGHVVPLEEYVSKKSKFSGMLLIDPPAYEREASFCEMPDGSIVNIYQLLPLFEDEVKYRKVMGTDAFLNLFENNIGKRPLSVLDAARGSCIP